MLLKRQIDNNTVSFSSSSRSVFLNGHLCGSMDHTLNTGSDESKFVLRVILTVDLKSMRTVHKDFIPGILETKADEIAQWVVETLGDTAPYNTPVGGGLQ